MLLADGTAKVTWLNFVLFMIGVTDIKGAYHLVGIGLIDSENAEQITVLIEKLAEGANLIRAIQDKREVQLEHGASDNSDAIQLAIENNGGRCVNDKVHFNRNVAKFPNLNVPSGKTKKEVIVDIQRLLSRMDETTMFDGLCNQRPIASRMQSLLLTELEDMGQGAKTDEKNQKNPHNERSC